MYGVAELIRNEVKSILKYYAIQYMLADPETGAHTQNIENTWWKIKRTLPATQS